MRDCVYCTASNADITLTTVTAVRKVIFLIIGTNQRNGVNKCLKILPIKDGPLEVETKFYATCSFARQPVCVN